MAQNSLAPGFVKLFYQSPQSLHTAVIPCRPYQTVAGEWWLNLRGGGPGNIWTGFVNTYVGLLRAISPTSMTFQYAELWTVASPGANPQFRETLQINLAGTNVAALSSATQMVFSFRTANGGVGRIVHLNGVFGPNQRFSAPSYGNAAILAIVNHLTAGSSWITGRDDGYVVAVPKVLTKTNDALRRRYGLVS